MICPGLAKVSDANQASLLLGGWPIVTQTQITFRMDLIADCTLDETKELEYSTDKPLNREPSRQELIKQYVSMTGILFDPNELQ